VSQRVRAATSSRREVHDRRGNQRLADTRDLHEAKLGERVDDEQNRRAHRPGGQGQRAWMEVIWTQQQGERRAEEQHEGVEQVAPQGQRPVRQTESHRGNPALDRLPSEAQLVRNRLPGRTRRDIAHERTAAGEGVTVDGDQHAAVQRKPAAGARPLGSVEGHQHAVVPDEESRDGPVDLSHRLRNHHGEQCRARDREHECQLSVSATRPTHCGVSSVQSAHLSTLAQGPGRAGATA
jgi:hypothetical protein